MTSVAQLSANRANAARSTEPRTPEGRAATVFNARKHGLCRSEHHALLPNESPEAWEQLVAALREDWAPLGAMEELLTLRIASAQLRLKRAALFEVGVVRAEIDDAGDDEDVAQAMWRDAVKKDALGKASRYMRDAEGSIRSSTRELERLQARRAGLVVPLPLEVEVSLTAASEPASDAPDP